VNLVHYLLRSSIILTERARRRHVKKFRRFSAVCLDKAYSTAPSLSGDGSLPLPKWAQFTERTIKDALRDRYPGVDDVRLVTTLDARLYARSFPAQGVIQISALTREYLRTVNLMLWNIIYKHRMRGVDKIPVEQLFEIILPYIISLYRDLDISYLPLIRAHSPAAIHWAQITTAVQLNFTLAHEYAHMVLHGHMTAVDLNLEREADAFAYALLAGEPFTGDEGLAPGDLWTATRWLFHFLQIVRIVGAAINECPIDWRQADITEREHAMYPFILPPGVSLHDHSIEVTGTVVLLAIKQKLYELGEAGIRNLAHQTIAQYDRKKRERDALERFLVQIGES
jgi:hypothetical protein